MYVCFCVWGLSCACPSYLLLSLACSLGIVDPHPCAVCAAAFSSIVESSEADLHIAFSILDVVRQLDLRLISSCVSADE